MPGGGVRKRLTPDAVNLPIASKVPGISEPFTGGFGRKKNRHVNRQNEGVLLQAQQDAASRAKDRHVKRTCVSRNQWNVSERKFVVIAAGVLRCDAMRKPEFE